MSRSLGTFKTAYILIDLLVHTGKKLWKLT